MVKKIARGLKTIGAIPVKSVILCPRPEKLYRNIYGNSPAEVEKYLTTELSQRYSAGDSAYF